MTSGVTLHSFNYFLIENLKTVMDRKLCFALDISSPKLAPETDDNTSLGFNKHGTGIYWASWLMDDYSWDCYNVPSKHLPSPVVLNLFWSL